MKTINRLLACITIIIFTISCSKDDDANAPSTTGTTYLKLAVSGPVVNMNMDEFKIIVEELEEDDHFIGGHIYDEETNEGNQKVASLFFTRLFGADQDWNFEMVVPAATGEKEIGTEFPNPAASNGDPVFYMEIDFKDSDYALYDNDNDGDDDRLQDYLRAKTVGVTITEIEEAHNSLGILTLARIKGSFQGTAYFTAYTGPTSEPEELVHTITGEFEYNLPSD